MRAEMWNRRGPASEVPSRHDSSRRGRTQLGHGQSPLREHEALAAVAHSIDHFGEVPRHFNHAVELTDASRAAIASLLEGGVPVANQSVLLHGVNDNVAALAELMTALLEARVKPYYLHHPDRVPGSARFRVGIEQGLQLHDELSKLVSGLALPAYVIDVPDGSGKVAVSSLEALGSCRFRAPNGFEWDDIG